MTETDFYKNDNLGLKELNERNAIKFIALPSKHIRWT